MKNANLLDQFFLIDSQICEELIGLLDLGEKDTLVEIGAGDGKLTKELVKKEAKIIAVEIDKRFSKDLEEISGNLQVIFADALEVVQNKKKYPISFNKITGSLPSSIVEPVMHLLLKIDFDLAVFILPLKFAYKLSDHEIFSLYLESEIIKPVSRKSFLPIPKTNWALVKSVKKPNALKAGDQERFLKQYVYEHPLAEKPNALREGLIKYYRSQGKKLTKNEARKLLAI